MVNRTSGFQGPGRPAREGATVGEELGVPRKHQPTTHPTEGQGKKTGKGAGGLGAFIPVTQQSSEALPPVN